MPGPNNYDDIIRQAIGNQAFGGSQLKPMIEDWLNQVDTPPPIVEGQMPPMSDWRRMTEGGAGPSQQIPYIPYGDPSGPMIIPNLDERSLAADPDMPLARQILRHSSSGGKGQVEI